MVDEAARMQRRCDKIYTGSYTYSKNGNTYLQEKFNAYIDHEDLAMLFSANVYGRIITGEMLKIDIEYKVSKELIPIFLNIKKSLGGSRVTEQYQHQKGKGTLLYSFSSQEGTHQETIQAHSVFSIAAPCCCTSFFFLKTKKEDINNTNLYYIFHSFNNWTFESVPSTRPICVQREGTNYKSIQLGNKTNVPAIIYKVFESDRPKDSPTITSYVSNNTPIPYRISEGDGTKIQMDYFQNYDREAV